MILPENVSFVAPLFSYPKGETRIFISSPTDAKFASCSDDGTVRIWDFQRCEEERVRNQFVTECEIY